MNRFQMLIWMYAAALLYDSTQMLGFAVVRGVLEAHLHAELNVDIYFNLISYPHIPHGRLLWQSHINLWLVNIHLAKSPSTWWIFMRWARPSPHSSSSSMALARTCLFQQTGAHAAVILVLIVLQLGLRVTVAQLSMANKSFLPTKERSLKGREEKMVVAGKFRLVKCQATLMLKQLDLTPVSF